MSTTSNTAGFLEGLLGGFQTTLSTRERLHEIKRQDALDAERRRRQAAQDARQAQVDEANAAARRRANALSDLQLRDKYGLEYYDAGNIVPGSMNVPDLGGWVRGLRQQVGQRLADPNALRMVPQQAQPINLPDTTPTATFAKAPGFAKVGPSEADRVNAVNTEVGNYLAGRNPDLGIQPNTPLAADLGAGRIALPKPTTAVNGQLRVTSDNTFALIDPRTGKVTPVRDANGNPVKAQRPSASTATAATRYEGLARRELQVPGSSPQYVANLLVSRFKVPELDAWNAVFRAQDAITRQQNIIQDNARADQRAGVGAGSVVSDILGGGSGGEPPESRQPGPLGRIVAGVENAAGDLAHTVGSAFHAKRDAAADTVAADLGQARIIVRAARQAGKKDEEIRRALRQARYSDPEIQRLLGGG